jgi:hypothetical protein
MGVDARETRVMQITCDYSAPAELFFAPQTGGYRKMTYRRFPTAAEAIAFVMEDLGPAANAMTTLQVDEERFDRRTIQRLYDASAFPLRKAAAA